MLLDFIEYVRKDNVVVRLKPWSKDLWYFEVTNEQRVGNSRTFDCYVIKRTLPVHYMPVLKSLPKNLGRKIIEARANQLWEKYKDC